MPGDRPRGRLPRPTQTATSLALGTSAAPGHCASSSLHDFHVRNTCTGRCARDARAGRARGGWLCKRHRVPAQHISHGGSQARRPTFESKSKKQILFKKRPSAQFNDASFWGRTSNSDDIVLHGLTRLHKRRCRCHAPHKTWQGSLEKNTRLGQHCPSSFRQCTITVRGTSRTSVSVPG